MTLRTKRVGKFYGKKWYKSYDKEVNTKVDIDQYDNLPIILKPFLKVW